MVIVGCRGKAERTARSLPSHMTLAGHAAFPRPVPGLAKLRFIATAAHLLYALLGVMLQFAIEYTCNAADELWRFRA